MRKLVPLLDMTKTCVAGEPPPCARACPLHIDVRGFVEKCQAGQYDAAWRLYNRDAVLSGITCYLCGEPCARACIREKVDTPVSIAKLERFLLNRRQGVKAASFFVPPKKNRILVLGGGAAGLTCAVKLAGRGYPVDLFEREAKLGGSIWRYVPESITEDAVLAEMQRISAMNFLSVHTGRDVTRLDRAGYAAVIIATGRNGGTFGALAEMNANGVFPIGNCIDPEDDTLTVIRKSAEISYKVENFCKVGRALEQERRKYVCHYEPDAEKVKPIATAVPLDGEITTEAQAQAEAARCILCQCANCFDGCHMMRHARKNAERLSKDISDTVNRTALNRKTALRQIMGCDQCGKCEAACPANVNFQALTLECRRYLHETRSLPDARYDFYLNDMEHANGGKSAFLKLAPAGVTEYLLFPGCQMSAGNPEYILPVLDRLNEISSGKAGLLQHCCGIPALWAGNLEAFARSIDSIRRRWQEAGKPAMVVACPSCFTVFEKHLPEIPRTSLWTLLAEHAEQKTQRGQTVSVFDPCSSKRQPDVQEAIRTLVKRAGYGLHELPEDGDTGTCCGYGGLMRAAGDGVADEMARACGERSAYPFVTYCTNCRDSFLKQGKQAVHILELLFPEEREPGYTTTELNDRRKNREMLKEQMAGEARAKGTEEWEEIELLIPDDVRAKMNDSLILEENVKKVICHARRTKQYLMKGTDGPCIACQQQRNVTFWVEYAREESGEYLVKNAYFHRLQIGPEEKEWNRPN